VGNTYKWVIIALAIFFPLVSLEIKCELLIGELNFRQKALLPGIATLSDMLCKEGCVWNK